MKHSRNQSECKVSLERERKRLEESFVRKSEVFYFLGPSDTVLCHSFRGFSFP